MIVYESEKEVRVNFRYRIIDTNLCYTIYRVVVVTNEEGEEGILFAAFMYAVYWCELPSRCAATAIFSGSLHTQHLLSSLHTSPPPPTFTSLTLRNLKTKYYSLPSLANDFFSSLHNFTSPTLNHTLCT